MSNKGEKAQKGNKAGKATQAGKAETKPSSEKGKDGAATSTEQAMPKFSVDFAEWFNEILMQADIIDYRYNLKGCGVWLPYGFKIRRNVLNIMRNLLESTPIPHEETLFPMLIPEPQFMKEAEHVKGFEKEVYWVKDGGIEPLEVKLALRPTSETAMYPMFALWIRSHQDLPLKVYQIVNTFRYETKNTRPLIRVREITTFKEAHTCHATAEDAQNQVREAVGIYKAFFDAMGVPYVVNCRPKWDTFPGADYSIAFDSIFPGRHRFLQCGTVHNLGQTFGKTFNIVFETKDGKSDFTYQTCYGVSERAIAALIAQHGDDFGIKLPPKIAPISVVVIPIIFKGKEQLILDACNKVVESLKSAGLTAQIDIRNISPGRKFFHWEMRGVPLRVEIGPKDLEKNSVCIVRRDIKKKEFIPMSDAVPKIKELLDEIQKSLWTDAKDRHKACLLRTSDLQEAVAFLTDEKGVVEVPFCGDNGCAADIEKHVEGLKFLGVPEEYLGALYDQPKEETEAFCIQCQKPVKTFWRIGRSY